MKRRWRWNLLELTIWSLWAAGLVLAALIHGLKHCGGNP